MTTTERACMTVPGWSSAHLLGPAGNGRKTNCGRHVAVEPTPAAEGMRRCTKCQEPTRRHPPAARHSRVSGGVMVDPDRPCPHEDFTAVVEINRLSATEGGPVEGYSATIRVHCTQCGEPFRWIGVPAGLQPHRPCCSVDETELRAPLRPASSDPDFGLGIPGFAVRWSGS